MKRRVTNTVQVGNVTIGGNAPVVVQSMTNTDTKDIIGTVTQINALANAGCEIVRVAVVDKEAARALGEIKRQISIPLVADIHFDYRLALLAIDNGVDKLRINPGNIGSESKVREVVKAAAAHGIPIRIGVNSGSLSKRAVEQYGRSADAMVASALEHVAILERHGFTDIVISMKATDISLTLEAHEKISHKVDYPIHLGITEAGTTYFGTIKSAAGLGALLSRGIGDTIRVSLTADPREEVKAAWALLKAMNLRSRGPTFISCPTCGRTQIPLEEIAKEVERRLASYPKPITIAIMGCPVNGPGEASHADLGIAGGNQLGLVFSRGKIIRKVPEAQLVDALVEEAYKLSD